MTYPVVFEELEDLLAFIQDDLDGNGLVVTDEKMLLEALFGDEDAKQNK